MRRPFWGLLLTPLLVAATPDYIQGSGGAFLAKVESVDILWADPNTRDMPLSATFGFRSRDELILRRLPQQAPVYTLGSLMGAGLRADGQKVSMDWLSDAQWLYLAPEAGLVLVLKQSNGRWLAIAGQFTEKDQRSITLSRERGDLNGYTSPELQLLLRSNRALRQDTGKKVRRTAPEKEEPTVPELPPDYEGQGPEFDSAYYQKSVKLNNRPHESLQFEQHGANINFVNDDQIHGVAVRLLGNDRILVEHQGTVYICRVTDETFYRAFRKNKKNGEVELTNLGRGPHLDEVELMDFLTLTFAKESKRKSGRDNWKRNEEGHYFLDVVIIHERIN